MHSRVRLILTIGTMAILVAACQAQDGVTVTTEPEAEVPTPTTAEGESPVTTEVDEPDDADVDVEGGRTLTIAISGDVETLDSDFSRFQRANEVNFNTQDQFFRYGTAEADGYFVADTSVIEPGSVESWEYSDDGTQVVLSIRTDQTFSHTGNPLTADDFIYWFDRSEGTESGYFFNVSTAGIESWDKTGDHEVTLTFSQPSPFFQLLFRDQSQAPVDSVEMTAQATDDDPWATDWKANQDAASGEYYVESWTPGVEMVLAANPDHWDDAPYFDRIVLMIIPSSSQRALLLQDGAVDIARDLSVDELDAIRGSEGVEVLSVLSRNQYHVGLNANQEPFDDVRVRQALAYAVPVDAIVDGVLGGRALPPGGAVANEGHMHADGGWPYEFDQARARQLLEDAGLGDGFSFDLAIEQGNPTIQELAVTLQASFREIGVEMSIDQQASAVFAQGLEERNHHAWLRDLLWFIDDPAYIANTFYACDAVINWMNYCNDQVDQLRDEMMAIWRPEDDSLKEELAAEFQRVTGEEVPTLILAEPNFELAMRSDIAGYTHLPDHLLWWAPLMRTP